MKSCLFLATKLISHPKTNQATDLYKKKYYQSHQTCMSMIRAWICQACELRSLIKKTLNSHKKCAYWGKSMQTKYNSCDIKHLFSCVYTWREMEIDQRIIFYFIIPCRLFGAYILIFFVNFGSQKFKVWPCQISIV